MAAERPPLDQIFISSKGAGIDNRPPLDSVFKTKPKDPGSIYNKGGIYEQFGPNPPMFNPAPGAFGGIVQTGADQPGTALPFIGQTIAGEAGPIGGVAGALAGEGVRQGMGRLFGVQRGADPIKQFKKAGEIAATGEVLGYGLNKGAEALAEPARQFGVRIARNIIRPSGRLAKRGDKIAETALKEGVLGSSAKSTMGKVKGKLDQVEQEIDDLINQHADKKITAEGALQRMDALARRYRQLGDSPAADKVESVKRDLIQNQGLVKPVYGEKETSQFVMGPSSKQVTPQKKIFESVPGKGFHEPSIEKNALQKELNDLVENESLTLEDMSGNFKGGQIIRPEDSQTGYRTSLPDYMKHPKTGNKPKNIKQFKDLAKDNLSKGKSTTGSSSDYEEVNAALDALNKKTPNDPSWKFAESEKKNRIITPQKYLDNPEDIVAMNIPETEAQPQRIISISPKEEYSMRPETFGVSKKERIKIGDEPRQISLKEGQGMKRGQYRLLEGKRVGGGWDASTTTPEIKARQEYAGGLRREISRQVPEIDAKNRRFGDLIDLANASEGRASVESRNNIFDLGDTIMGAAASTNPKALALLGLKKGAQFGKGIGAKSFYGFGRPESKEVRDLLKSPSARALLASFSQPVYN